MINPADIEAAFVSLCTDAGLDCLPYEPKALPRMLPVVTMLWVGAPQVATATGEITVTNMWKIHCYVSMADWRSGQKDMQALVPQVLKITRDSYNLLGTCEDASVQDPGDEPIFDANEGYLLKSLDLQAITVEPG